MKIRVPSSVNVDHTRTIAFCDRETLARPMDFDKSGNPIKYAMSCPFCGAGVFSDLITDLYCTNCKAGYVEEVPKMADPFINPLFANKTNINVINNIVNNDQIETAEEGLSALKEIVAPPAKPKPKSKPRQGNSQRGLAKNARKNDKADEKQPDAEPVVSEQIVANEEPESLIANVDDIDKLLDDESLRSLIDG